MKQYTVSDGKSALTLQEAETIREAFEDSRDSLAALAASGRKLMRRPAGVKARIEGRSKGTLVHTAVS